MVLTNCTLKLKNVCGIDGNAITNVLYNKLCLLICTYLGPTKKRIFRTVLQVLLSYINTFAEITSLLHTFCRDHSR